MFRYCHHTDQEIARTTAAILLESGAVMARTDPLFELTSGRKSPVYVDCRRLLSFPRARHVVMDFLVSKVISRIGVEALDGVAGGETAGIAYAAWLADRLFLPMVYVRKAPRNIGRAASIEGVIVEGARMLLVEDLCTDGGSKIRFCAALRRAGAQVQHVLVVFNYDIFHHSREVMAQAGLTLHGLTTWAHVLALARERRQFSDSTLERVESFLSEASGESAGSDPSFRDSIE